MKNLKKYISVFLVAILIIGLLPQVNTVIAEEIEKDYEYVLDENVEIQLPETFEEDIDIVEDSSETAIVETNVEMQEEEINVKAQLDKEANDITVTSTEISSDGTEVIKEYNVEITEATEDVLIATFTDLETNEKYFVDTTQTEASIAFLVPIGVVLGGSLVSHLIAISAATVIAGVTYYAATKVVSTLKRKDPKHYIAKLYNGKLYIGNSVSQSTAASHLRAGGDIWSRSSSLAWTIADKAGYYAPTKAEKHGTGSNYFWHYHARDAYNKRIGGHSFY
ncbi:SAR2788 family putative toxin [Bacillus alveayuensis]|uniref:SAR2788 family putative toxin n=1 Tax=Aeribacillus alveayuensis TaxID=279215 RepID=UPI0005D0FB97|nr:SAR2788 family putative toxin [Bacillus alveayuensis]